MVPLTLPTNKKNNKNNKNNKKANKTKKDRPLFFFYAFLVGDERRMDIFCLLIICGLRWLKAKIDGREAKIEAMEERESERDLAIIR